MNKTMKLFPKPINCLIDELLIAWLAISHKPYIAAIIKALRSRMVDDLFKSLDIDKSE